MDDPRMILTFNEDGTVDKETFGFEGMECTKQTQFVEDALKGKRKNFRRKEGRRVKAKGKQKLGGI